MPERRAGGGDGLGSENFPVALSPAGSVVVHLNSSTAAPAGAALPAPHKEIKLRLTG